MSVVSRLALVLGVLLLGGAAGVAFLPASPSGVTCGTWVSPEWDRERAQVMAEDAADTAEQADAMGADALAGEAGGLALRVARNYRLCDDTLSGRRTWSLILLGAAVIVPAAVLFVGAARPRSTSVGGPA